MSDKEESEDEHFKRTGVSRMKLEIDFKITQKDMEIDLVKRTEGKMIEPKLPKNENLN